MDWPGEGSAGSQPLERLGRRDSGVGTAGALAAEPAWEWGHADVSPWTACHLACLFLSHPSVPAHGLAWELTIPKPPALLCCLGCSLIRNSSKLTRPCGLSFDVTWEHPRVPIPCGTFVFDLATRGSWNCFLSVMLPNVKNKFSLHFLVRKSYSVLPTLPLQQVKQGRTALVSWMWGLPLGVWVSQNCS